MNRSTRGQRLRALVVDVAGAQRNGLVEVLNEGDIAVVGQPDNAAEAIEQVAQTRPDVVILDLHLPGDQSQHAIEQIMARTPTPILVLSARDNRQSPSAVQALVAGALDALPRPRQWTPELAAELRRTVRLISAVHVIRHPRGGLAKGSRRDATPRSGGRPVVAIAASTGGPSALATILSGSAGLQAPGTGGPTPARRLRRWLGGVDVEGIRPTRRDSQSSSGRPRRTDLPGTRRDPSPASAPTATSNLQSSQSACTVRRLTSCSSPWPRARVPLLSASC